MQRLLIDLHLGAWVAVIVLVAVVLASGLPAAIRGHQPPAIYLPLRRTASALIVLQVVIGGLLFATGTRPQTTLHLVYAAAALIIVPASRALARRSRGSARWYELGGTFFLLGVLFRLLTTG